MKKNQAKTEPKTKSPKKAPAILPAVLPHKTRCSSRMTTHVLDLPPCCPVSKNPRPGSCLEISYRGGDFVLEVAALLEYVQSYQGGRGDVRDMEGMIEQIAQDCALALRWPVKVKSTLILDPGPQKMVLECDGFSA